MEKTSILDFVTRLSELASKPKPDATKKQQTDVKTSENQTENTNSQTLLSDENKNSFMKSYNPFGEVQKGKSQLSMPKAPKPTKNKIDLSLSKGIEKPRQSDGAKNMIDLINRHNAFSAKIKRD